MQSISTIGLDIAKSVFQVHGVDAAGQAVLRRQLRRRHVLAFFQKLSPCLVGIEACRGREGWFYARARGARACAPFVSGGLCHRCDTLPGRRLHARPPLHALKPRDQVEVGMRCAEFGPFRCRREEGNRGRHKQVG